MSLAAALLLALALQEDAGSLKLALVSLKCQPTDGADAAANAKNLQINLERHFYFIEKAAAQGADFVGFPELSLNGYHFSKTMTWLKLDGPELGALAKKAIERKLYVSAGLAEEDADGRKWNTQVVIGPDGKRIGLHHKIWLTAERGYTETGTDHAVFEVKGLKMGISTCADGSDFGNLKALVDGGARLIYGPHANTTGGTLAGWYRFRGRWGGAADGKELSSKTSNDGPAVPMPVGGWVATLKVHAALHNHAALYNPAFDPPPAKEAPSAFASGAWVIGPDGATLAQTPPSSKKEDSKEDLLFCTIPIAKP